jgi:hypothetical protein
MPRLTWLAVLRDTRTRVVVAMIAAALGGAHGCGRPAPAVPASAPPMDPSGDALAVAAKLDAKLEAAWKKEGIDPAPEADDATFLRRAYLDVTGVVPPAGEVTRFAADRAPDKRDQVIRALLASEGYPRHWTNVWDEALMGSPARGRQFVDRIELRRWLYASLARDVGWDAIAREIVAGVGQNTVGGKPDMTEWDMDTPEARAPGAGVNGAVNFSLHYGEAPQNLAGKVSRVFLGVQLQCAECHDHPTESWKRDDFRRFTAAFMRTTAEPIDRGKQMGKRRVRVIDLTGDDDPHASRRAKNRLAKRSEKTGFDDDNPTALDGTTLEPKPRQKLAEWMTSTNNRWFALAAVNRIWAHFNGRGFVHPVDGLGRDPLKDADVPEAMKLLAEDFSSHGYDLRRLIRIVCATKAYRRSAESGDEARLWSRFRPRPMSAAQLLDSLVASSNIAPVIGQIAGDRFGRVKLALRKQFTFAFDVDDDGGDDDSFTGTVPQSLMLMNGALTAGASAALEGSTVGTVARSGKSGSEQIAVLYRAALSREPTAGELASWTSTLDAASTAAVSAPRGATAAGPGAAALARAYRKLRVTGYSARDQVLEDLFWTLLNSSEFFFIH